MGRKITLDSLCAIISIKCLEARLESIEILKPPENDL